MKAYVTYVDSLDTSEQIEVNGHELQFGGAGDGFCYVHQDFDCLGGLSDEEWEAISQAEPSNDPSLS